MLQWLDPFSRWVILEYQEYHGMTWWLWNTELELKLKIWNTYSLPQLFRGLILNTTNLFSNATPIIQLIFVVIPLNWLHKIVYFFGFGSFFYDPWWLNPWLNPHGKNPDRPTAPALRGQRQIVDGMTPSFPYLLIFWSESPCFMVLQGITLQ